MSRLSVVLLRPARAANVGAAARALKNFGHSDLRVVDGDAALPGGAEHAEARALAWNSLDVLMAARPCGSLAEAVADLALAAASTGRDEPGRDVLTPREFAAEVAALPAGARAGCVFGPEDHGLSNAELDTCRTRLRIPTSAAQPSLNLAQSVVIVSYEVAMATGELAGEDAVEADGGEEAVEGLPATEGDLERLAAAGRDLLLAAGFLNPQAPDHVLGELRRLLGRARPTAREAHLLSALVKQLDWARRNGEG